MSSFCVPMHSPNEEKGPQHHVEKRSFNTPLKKLGLNNFNPPSTSQSVRGL